MTTVKCTIEKCTNNFKGLCLATAISVTDTEDYDEFHPECTSHDRKIPTH